MGKLIKDVVFGTFQDLTFVVLRVAALVCVYAIDDMPWLVGFVPLILVFAGLAAVARGPRDVVGCGVAIVGLAAALLGPMAALVVTGAMAIIAILVLFELVVAFLHVLG